MIRIGSRGSKLALVQAEWTAACLREQGLECAIEVIKTKGDVVMDRFDKIEGKGFFTAEIEAALMESRIDLAVHCLKDLPTAGVPDLKIAAVTERENPFDVIVAPKSLAADASGMPDLSGLRIGTSSNRRVAGLAHLFPDASFVPIRGNVPTRINKMKNGEADVVVLAAAGLNRLDYRDESVVVYELNEKQLVPAPGQGALAMQVRAEDVTDYAFLHHSLTEVCTSAERRVLATLEGGCQVPLGVWAAPVQDGFAFHLFLGLGEGKPPLRLSLSGSDLDALADQAVAEVKQQLG